MTEVYERRFRGCGRGIFGLSSWERLRKPGNSSIKSDSGYDKSSQQELSQQETSQSFMSKEPNQTSTQQNSESSSRADDSAPLPPKEGQKILAKYRYAANPQSPLGEEISLEAGQVVIFKAAHPANEHWWYATSPDGLKGYVPALYMMIVEEQVTGLPWLNTRVEEEKPSVNNTFGAPEKPVWKAYKSSYNHEGLPQQSVKEYYCELCAKQLNGPAPYDAHMRSKAHKEEVELSKEYGRQ